MIVEILHILLILWILAQIFALGMGLAMAIEGYGENLIDYTLGLDFNWFGKIFLLVLYSLLIPSLMLIICIVKFFYWLFTI